MDEKRVSHSFAAVVIDDDPVVLALIRAGLELVAGWRVTTESAAVPGIESVGRESPDVVVVDYLLPEMDGLEVCRRLKADPVTAGIPVVILTGRTTIGADEVRSAGAEGIIFKPVDPRTLAGAIEEVIGGFSG
jgi:CheY-like chemotaxis protein